MDFENNMKAARFAVNSGVCHKSPRLFTFCIICIIVRLKKFTDTRAHGGLAMELRRLVWWDNGGVNSHTWTLFLAKQQYVLVKTLSNRPK